MTIESCDKYFTKHIAGDQYFRHEKEEREKALNTAVTDLASCGAGHIKEESPELLKSALCEQTLFVLSRKDSYTGNEREVISESIDGVGSCHYTSSGCPAHISVKTYALVDAYYRIKNYYLSRG